MTKKLRALIFKQFSFQGSRKCGMCPNGYQGDGVTCSYVSACAVNNGGCHSLATCRVGPSSEILCLCPAGYQGSGKGPQGCKLAENACKSNPCIHGACNPQGTDNYNCICNAGYTGKSISSTSSKILSFISHS